MCAAWRALWIQEQINPRQGGFFAAIDEVELTRDVHILNFKHGEQFVVGGDRCIAESDGAASGNNAGDDREMADADTPAEGVQRVTTVDDSLLQQAACAGARFADNQRLPECFGERNCFSGKGMAACANADKAFFLEEMMTVFLLVDFMKSQTYSINF